MSTDTSRFVPWNRRSPLLDAIGGFLCDPADPRHMGFTVEGAKLNARSFLHAGAITAIADVAIGHALAGLADPPTRLVTINLSCDLFGTARAGEWVDVIVTPTRLGRRLGAGSATFSTDCPIANISALFVPASPGPAARSRDHP